MAILNYTTKISASKTIGELQEILVEHGADKIVCDYDKERRPSAVTFGLPMNGNMVYFQLPANYQGVLKAMTKDKSIKSTYCNLDQAVRTAWRIIKDWVEAQCAIIEAGLAEMSEIFLPYAITKSGSTLYTEIKNSKSNLLLTNI